jgi:hypothetical protein
MLGKVGKSNIKNYFLKIHKNECLIQFRSPYFIVLVLLKNSTNFKQIHGGPSCSIFSINHISNNPRNLNFAVNNLDWKYYNMNFLLRTLCGVLTTIFFITEMNFLVHITVIIKGARLGFFYYTFVSSILNFLSDVVLRNMYLRLKTLLF